MIRLRFFRLLLPLLAVLVTACEGARKVDALAELRAASCTPVESNKNFDETPYVGSTSKIQSFQNIRANINSSCSSCHQTPAHNGGFTYNDSWQAQDISIDGKFQSVPGISEVAERMRDSIRSADDSKRMPPKERRAKNPSAFLEMATHIDQWIQAGKPNGSFKVGEVDPPLLGKPRPSKPHPTTELGDCVPKPGTVGYDYGKDRQFESMTELPANLTDTDMVTLDPYVLARHGTVAYNVEYPLWADNADKGRFIHVPMKAVNGEILKQSVAFNAEKKQFEIPENTRFYKSFYRAITLPNGRTLMRRMETRIIVSRTPWEKSLFGTYQWDETEQVATLVTAPYRDGTPWKDLVSDIVVDTEKMKVRPYAIPGRQRCIDCHMGSPTRNFVLGFQPLQINKRSLGGAGRLTEPEAHDLDQVSRFIAYGVLSKIGSYAELPVLETSGALPPKNLYELRANGYTVGNCYHCHNANGLAFTNENGIKLPLGPGDLFQFNTQQKSVQVPNRRIVHQNGELDGSHIWRKVTDSAAQLGMFSQMPMHTPGSPDCTVQTVIGKWIRSVESEQAAEDWQPDCALKKKENPFAWIDMDFTWLTTDTYTPRRNDWRDPASGMPERYRKIELSPELKSAIQTEYAVGYWLKKPECSFPKVDLPLADRRPWMMRGDQPKRPFGEVYSTTPGSYFFRNTCVKCHGPKGDGDSALARGILTWSGGSVRVANFVEGLFGNKGGNLKTFDGVGSEAGKNFAGNYLIWMAMEGTRVRFPPEVSSFMGKHGGQMLNGIRDKCLAQIATDKPSSVQFMDHEIFRKVCFLNNLAPGDPDLAFDPSTNKPIHPERVEEWLDRGAWNSGWAIFEFLKESAEKGPTRPANDQCEVPFGPAPLPTPLPPAVDPPPVPANPLPTSGGTT
ncbi:hypothetical protein BH10BDE1_BH10BDE1_03750 [soil metagenome]